MLVAGVACPGQLAEHICHFDIDLHPEAFVGHLIQICRFQAVNRSLVRSCIVISIQKFSLAGARTLFASTMSSEVEESVVKSLSDINSRVARNI